MPAEDAARIGQIAGRVDTRNFAPAVTLTCRVCGRHLIARESRERGIGPVCEARESPPVARVDRVEVVTYDDATLPMFGTALAVQLWWGWA